MAKFTMLLKCSELYQVKGYSLHKISKDPHIKTSYVIKCCINVLYREFNFVTWEGLYIFIAHYRGNTRDNTSHIILVWLLKQKHGFSF